MDIKRYITVKAIKTKKNELIPIWDNRIRYIKDKYYGDYLSLNDQYDKFFNLIDCIYDIKEKKLINGIELDYYPVEKELEFKIGDDIFYEISYRKLSEGKITNIVYEEYEMDIIKGSKVNNYIKENFKEIEFNINNIYAIKKWKPFYMINNHIKIEYVHELYHKVIK